MACAAACLDNTLRLTRWCLLQMGRRCLGQLAVCYQALIFRNEGAVTAPLWTLLCKIIMCRLHHPCARHMKMSRLPCLIPWWRALD